MRKGFYLILILLFPSIIYMLFSLGEHRFEKIRSFGTWSLTSDGDTVYAPIPNLSVRSHTGEEFSLNDLRGKPVVFDVFGVPCDEPCRKKGVTLVNYLNELPDRDKWTVISLANSLDISKEELALMHANHLPDMTNWLFVAATDSRELNSFLEYTFVDTKVAPSVEDLPVNEFALVDQNGVIRSFFDSRIYMENRKLEDAIKLLLQEPFLTWKENKPKK